MFLQFKPSAGLKKGLHPTPGPVLLNSVIEDFFGTKFVTTYSRDKIVQNPADETILGLLESVLSADYARDLMKPITWLNWIITSMSWTPARQRDWTTWGMGWSRSLGVKFAMLLEMFNNVMSGAQIPSDWKMGDGVLILKKPHATNIANYWLITLISCLSKLLVKILAEKLAAVIETEDIVGPKQNGFRSSRSFSNNLFILNTLLEANRSCKLLSPLLLWTWKRPTIGRLGYTFCKVKPAQFQATVVKFLNNYYFQDSIGTASVGLWSQQQYQKQGLRQGCNLSSGLFILYLVELEGSMLAG